MNQYSPWLVIIFSLAFAVLLTMLPLPFSWNWYRPEWPILALCAWMILLPNTIGVWTAWWLGLFIDILLGTLVGSHALAYAVVAFLVSSLQRRMCYSMMWQKAIFVSLMVFLSLLIIYILLGLTGNFIFDIRFFAPVLTSFVCWPCIDYFLAKMQKKYRLYQLTSY